MIPPLLIKMRITNGHYNIPLWLPLILLWPLIIAIALFLAPFALAAYLITVPRALWPVGWRLLPAFYSFVCAMRGINVSIGHSQSGVAIDVV